MATKITEQYIDSFISRLQDRFEALDSELQGIAAQSQRTERADLRAGQTVKGYRPTTVIGDTYVDAARDAELRAYHDIEAMFDRLDRDAEAGRAEVATADEVATVTLALSLNPNEATLRDLWAVHGHNSTLRKAIRQAAGRADILLPIDPNDAAADNRGDARNHALSHVSNRWTPKGWAELGFLPSARIDAESVRQHLLGVDMFGRPLN